MVDRPWSDADRELVAQALFEFGRYDSERPWPWWAEHHPRMAEHARERAAAVLDALTAAGWEPRCDCDGVAHDLPILRSHIRGEPGCTAHAYRGGTDAR